MRGKPRRIPPSENEVIRLTWSYNDTHAQIAGDSFYRREGIKALGYRWDPPFWRRALKATPRITLKALLGVLSEADVLTAPHPQGRPKTQSVAQWRQDLS